ncbi:DUF3800 domain-containing protein [Qipengyuania profunda]|jgi:hypothetical protein|uniref:DUF3800 domain-containing protein n=1 Tax=Qipengyuania profunda TaxID=3113984 RepID=UPI002A186CB2|nr:DUF3800 domain-containing protein [Qipengyuania sp. HL-TH1]WPL57801.1 DUF3800 domain-containing protein [Qipengyuania sp. HL-TH5]
MYAFVDETGNTGGNLFDEDQPLFLTAALITRSDFDRSKARQFDKILADANLSGIHATELGVGGIEPIAGPVLKLLKAADARFFISRVEKRYLLATKFFDTFFDSGENPAVPWHAYNVRPLRLILAFKVASLVDETVAQLFWKMLMERSEARARALIPEICAAVLARIDRLPDARSREIVTDALQWTRDHPEGLDFYQTGREAKNGHMPNSVAFTNLLEGLEALSKKWDRPVRLIRHDRQSQFERTLAHWHQLFSNALPDPIHLPGETRVLRQVPGSDFEISASEHSPGIQVADLILWLFKRFLEGKDIPYESGRLLSFAMKRGMQNDFSFDGVENAMLEQFGDALNSDPSPEHLEKAREIQAHYEQLRLDNIAAYDRDGLMPFERQATSSRLASD